MGAVIGVARQVVCLAAPLVATHPRPAILDPVVRAGLLIDLALAGSLTTTDAGLEVDTDPTGFAPADAFLSDVIKHPDKPLAWWLYNAPVTVHDLAEDLVETGTWQRRGRGPLRRYRPARPDERSTELTGIITALRGPQLDPRLAATVLLLGLLPLQDCQFNKYGLTQRCGSAGWLVGDLLDNLHSRQASLAAAGRDAQTTNSLTWLV